MFVILYINRVRKSPSEQPRVMNDGLYFDKDKAKDDRDSLNIWSPEFEYSIYELKEIK